MDGYVYLWDGTYFGWIDDGALYTRNGSEVGRLRGRAVFDRKGNYLGELRDDRLITNLNKKNNAKWLGFLPGMRVIGPLVKPMSEKPLDLPAGYEDFPAPETLH